MNSISSELLPAFLCYLLPSTSTSKGEEDLENSAVPEIETSFSTRLRPYSPSLILNPIEEIEETAEEVNHLFLTSVDAASHSICVSLTSPSFSSHDNALKLKSAITKKTNKKIEKQAFNLLDSRQIRDENFELTESDLNSASTDTQQRVFNHEPADQKNEEVTPIECGLSIKILTPLDYSQQQIQKEKRKRRRSDGDVVVSTESGFSISMLTPEIYDGRSQVQKKKREPKKDESCVFTLSDLNMSLTTPSSYSHEQVQRSKRKAHSKEDIELQRGWDIQMLTPTHFTKKSLQKGLKGKKLKLVKSTSSL